MSSETEKLTAAAATAEAPAESGAAAGFTPKFHTGRIFNIGLAFFTITLFWQVYDNIIPLFLKDFGLNKTWTGLVMALDNVFALILLPFIGGLSDRLPKKLQRFGKRMPFILFGSCMAAVTFLLVNHAHNAAAPGYSSGSLALTMVFLAFTLVFMCLYRTPAVSLMPDVTIKQHRSRANAIINIMGTVGGVAALIVMQFLLNTREGDGGELILTGNNWALFAVTGALMIISSVVLAATVRENKLVAEKEETLKLMGVDEDENEEGKSVKTEGLKPFSNLTRGEKKSLLFLLLSVALWYFAYNALTTHFSDFSLTVLKTKFTLPLMVAQAAGFLAFVPAVWVGKRLGRKKTILIGVSSFILGMALATVVVLPLMGNPDINANLIKGLMYPVFVFVGCGWAFINVHSFVMSVEFATKETNGFFTGLYYTFSMAAQVITPFLAGVFMDNIGYQMLMPYSLVFICLAFVTMLFVRHGNSRTETPTAPTSGAAGGSESIDSDANVESVADTDNTGSLKGAADGTTDTVHEAANEPDAEAAAKKSDAEE